MSKTFKRNKDELPRLKVKRQKRRSRIRIRMPLNVQEAMQEFDPDWDDISEAK